MNVVSFPNQSSRPMPVNVELEQAVLGALIMDNSVFQAVSSILKAEHFHEPIHSRVFEVASELIIAGKVASPLTLKTFLGDHDLGGVTVPQYLARLAAASSGAGSVRDYAEFVRDLAARRSMISVASDLIEKAHDLPVSVSAASVISDATTELMAITSGEGAQDTLRDPGQSASLLIDRAIGMRDKTVADRGVTTGIPSLDKDTGGFQPGTLWIVGARPGMGKTVFATSTAIKSARSGVGSLIFSLEVPETQIMARILADLAYEPNRPLPFGAVIRGIDLSDQDLHRLTLAQRELARLPIRIDVASRLTVAQIVMRVRGVKKRMAEHGIRLGVVFLDYLKMIQASDRYRGNRVYEVGEISGALKQLAKDEDLCVVLLAQLNRALEGRDDKRPSLADLRESGDLEADADVVNFIHREAYFIERSAKFKQGDPDAYEALRMAQNRMELVLGKNRAGEARTHHVWCDMGASSIAAEVQEWRA